MVNGIGEFIAKDNNGHIVFNKPVKRSIIAMPPAIMVDNLITVRVTQHTPPKAVVFNTFLFKRAWPVCKLYRFRAEQLIGI